MEQEPMLTVQEAADRLKLKPETIRVWLRTGEMPGFLINRRAGWRIPASEVEKKLRGEPTRHKELHARLYAEQERQQRPEGS